MRCDFPNRHCALNEKNLIIAEKPSNWRSVSMVFVEIKLSVEYELWKDALFDTGNFGFREHIDRTYMHVWPEHRTSIYRMNFCVLRRPGYIVCDKVT